MTTVSKTFSAVNQVSATLSVPANRSATYALAGTFVATLVLEFTLNNGVSWSTFTTLTTTQTSIFLPPQDGQLPTVYRWRCSAYTSGSPIGTIVNTVGTIADTVNIGQISSLTVTDTGIVSPLETITNEVITNLSISALLNLTGIETSLTAHAGGTQAAALALSAVLSVHNITTVTSAADSVKLPTATAGAVHIVINSDAANAMQVFAAATETINGVASATGVSQPAGTAVVYVCAVAGDWRTAGVLSAMSVAAMTIATLTSGIVNATTVNATNGGITTATIVNDIVTQALSWTGVENTLTAHAGGGQGSALALSATAIQHRVTVVATAGDSIALPSATAGRVHVVINSAALPMQVFGTGTDTINGIATATGLSQLAGTTALYICLSTGAWFRIGGTPVNAVVALADATVAANCALGNTFSITQSANNTLAAPINPVDGMVITYVVTQSAGGNTLAYNGIFSFSTTNASPTLSVAAAARDNLAFKYNAAAVKWDCVGIDLGH